MYLAYQSFTKKINKCYDLFHHLFFNLHLYPHPTAAKAEEKYFQYKSFICGLHQLENHEKGSYLNDLNHVVLWAADFGVKMMVSLNTWKVALWWLINVLKTIPKSRWGWCTCTITYRCCKMTWEHLMMSFAPCPWLELKSWSNTQLETVDSWDIPKLRWNDFLIRIRRTEWLLIVTTCLLKPLKRPQDLQ